MFRSRGGKMKNIQDAGFHWRAEVDGTILYRANEHSPTYVISRPDLNRITHAAELVAAAWWLTGFRTPEFALLIASIMIIPAGCILNFALVRHGILSRANKAGKDIELYAVSESIRSAGQYLTRNIASLWLWLANAILLFLCCEITIATVRFMRTPAFEYSGTHRPGPLDGLFYVGFVLFLVYVLTEELFRRRRTRFRAQARLNLKR
jgi:hypothetical protein